MRTKTFISASAIAFALTMSATASADTFCVHGVPSCSGKSANTLADAVSTASLRAFYVSNGGSLDHVAVTTSGTQTSVVGLQAEGGTTSVTDSSFNLSY